MNLNLLPIFLAIYECESVSRASERLQMSQSGVSTALNSLRIELRDPLFVRIGRGITPTPRAHAIAGSIRSILDAIEGDVVRENMYDPQQDDGEFKIALTDVGESTFLPRICALLAVQSPKALVRSISYSTDLVSQILEKGDADVALGDFPHLDSATLVQSTLGSYSFTCVVGSKHPLAGRKLSRAQFENLRQAAVVTDRGATHLLETYYRTSKMKRHIAVHTARYMTLPLLLADSDLMAIVPDRLSEHLVALGLVATAQPPVDFPKSTVKILWHRRLHNDQRNKWLRGMCINALRRT